MKKIILLLSWKKLSWTYWVVVFNFSSFEPSFPCKKRNWFFKRACTEFHLLKVEILPPIPLKSLSCTTVLKNPHAQAFLITRSNIKLILNFKTILSVIYKFNSSKLINLMRTRFLNSLFSLGVFPWGPSQKKVIEILLHKMTIWKHFQVPDIIVSTWVSEINTQMWSPKL